jgi:hypothetical protein
MRRILLVLPVALVMAAMVVVTAAPAFAVGGGGGRCPANPQGTVCTSGGGGNTAPGTGSGSAGGQADNIISDEKQGETEILAFGSGGPGIESGFNGARVCGAGSNTTCKGAI